MMKEGVKRSNVEPGISSNDEKGSISTTTTPQKMGVTKTKRRGRRRSTATKNQKHRPWGEIWHVAWLYIRPIQHLGALAPFMARYRSNITMSRYRCSWFGLWILAIGSAWIYSLVWFYSQPSSPTKGSAVAPYAIGVGLPKSGTTSLYHYFQCSGYPTSHYCCCGAINQTQYPCRGGKLMSEQLQDNLAAQKFLWADLQDAVVHAQLDGEVGKDSYFLPQFSLLQELHQSAPDAYWILPLRSPESWKASVIQWLDLDQRLRNFYRQQKISPGGDSALLSVDDDDDDSFLIEFYKLHTQRVRQFCTTRRPPGRCIEIEISDPNTGKELQQSFPKTKTDCWTRHNAGPMFQAFQAAP
jgi:hypothetical protein